MYAQIGKEYQNTLTDDRYTLFLRKTANSPHSARNKKIVRVMIRELADDGNQYLKYDIEDIRYDAIGAEWAEYCPNQGIYPIPISQPKIEFGDNMSTKDVVNGDIIRYDIGYEIPFTKENVDKIHELCNDISQSQRTQYIVKRYSGMKHSVIKYEDFRDKIFEELETGNGKATTTTKAKQ
jgi:hypothetical protein